MASPTHFADYLKLEEGGAGVFVGNLEDHGGASFGGEVFGLATLAAARSCPDRPVHSLHIHFLRPTPPATPVDFHVEHTRDGRRIAHRRVEVRHGERLCAQLVASFAEPAPDAVDFETLPFSPPAPPESLPSEKEVAEQENWEFYEPEVTEWRWPEMPWNVPAGTPSQYQGWVRPTEKMPDGSAMRSAALAYLSDFHSHLPVARVLGGSFEPVGYASLDIVVWIHRNVVWDDYWLLTSIADIAHGGRALTRRQLHDREGRLIATMMQEALIPNE